MIIHQASIEVKPYSISELAQIYEVSTRTLKNWMKPFDQEIGKRIGRFYTIPQVKTIFLKLDLPGKFVHIDSFKQAA